MCLPKILFPVFIFAFVFSLPLMCTWPLAFLIFSPPQWNFYVFLPTKFVSFVFTRFSSSSVIHVSVNIKNNVGKDTTLLLLLFFLSKRPGGHAIFLRYSLVAMPVVRTYGGDSPLLPYPPHPHPLNPTRMSTYPRPQRDPADKLWIMRW